MQASTPKPAGAKVDVLDLVGEKLGCSVDSSGEVKIGDKAGHDHGPRRATAKHFDEVTITITAPAAPAGGEAADERAVGRRARRAAAAATVASAVGRPSGPAAGSGHAPSHRRPS